MGYLKIAVLGFFAVFSFTSAMPAGEAAAPSLVDPAALEKAVREYRASHPAGLTDNGGAPLVSPGPGLPSLEEVGLTSAQLFDAAFIDPLLANLTLATPADGSSSSGARRWVDRCVDYNSKAERGQVRACAGYLATLGRQGTDCGGYGFNIMCIVGGDGHSTYVSTSNNVYASSNCEHAALGALWGADHCNPIFNSEAAAWGNGDFVVVNHGDWS